MFMCTDGRCERGASCYDLDTPFPYYKVNMAVCPTKCFYATYEIQQAASMSVCTVRLKEGQEMKKVELKSVSTRKS